MKDTFTNHGIEYRPIVAGNLLAQPFLKDYKIESNKKRTNADILHTQGVYVGNNHFVADKDMNFLNDVVGEINEKFR